MARLALSTVSRKWRSLRWWPTPLPSFLSIVGGRFRQAVGAPGVPCDSPADDIHFDPSGIFEGTGQSPYSSAISGRLLIITPIDDGQPKGGAVVNR
jgi:hypothetical protein